MTSTERSRRARAHAQTEHGLTGRAARKHRTELGLAIALRHARHGVPMTAQEIAYFCGTTSQAITAIELQALKKLRLRNPALRESLRS